MDFAMTNTFGKKKKKKKAYGTTFYIEAASLKHF